LTGVSCAGAEFCAAVDARGRVLEGNGASWSAPRLVDSGGGGLTGVSCATADFCAAVDAAGRAVTGNGTAWSRPRPVDADGGGLTAVSCPPGGAYCVGTDFDGQAVTLPGPGSRRHGH
jgi:hypothetical protein